MKRTLQSSVRVWAAFGRFLPCVSRSTDEYANESAVALSARVLVLSCHPSVDHQLPQPHTNLKASPCTVLAVIQSQPARLRNLQPAIMLVRSAPAKALDLSC